MKTVFCVFFSATTSEPDQLCAIFSAHSLARAFIGANPNYHIEAWRVDPNGTPLGAGEVAEEIIKGLK